MKLFIMILLFVCSIMVASAGDHPTFDSFMAKSKRKYSGAEKKKREQIFAKNLKRIDELNIKAKQSGHKTEYAVNDFSDMDIVEFRQKYMGLRIDHEIAAKNRKLARTRKTTTKTTKKTTTRTTTKPTTTTSKITTTIAPTTTTTANNTGSFDWSLQTGMMTPIKNQGGCGSCWAFAAVTLAETSFAKRGNPLTPFSEQLLVDCETTSFGCNGGYPNTALSYEQINGQIKSTTYPYTAADGTCKYSSGSVVANSKFSSYSYTYNEAEMINLLKTYGPILITIDADDIQNYKSGVIMSSACRTSINHAVVIVGYGTLNGVDFWKVRNSWGSGWGDNGYFRLQRNANTCGMTNYASYYIKA